MGDDPKKPKTTAAPPTPAIVAFPTLGDTRLIGKPAHSLSELMKLVSTKILGADVVLESKDSVEAKTKLEKKFPITGGVPARFISQVMFVGHGGPKLSPEVLFGFSGKPPDDPKDLHNFTFGGVLASSLTGPDIDLLDALAARFVIGVDVEVWFVCCYIGGPMTKAVAGRYKGLSLSKQKKSGTVRGYDCEIAFGWDGTDPTLRIEPASPFDAIAPPFGDMKFNKFETF